MSEKSLAPKDQMMQWITSMWITKPMFVIAELGIADLLKDGPLGIETLADKTNTNAHTLYRLMRALSSVGIFVEIEKHKFALTSLAQCLQSDAMRPLVRMFHSPWHEKAWDALIESVRTGRPGFDDAFEKPAFQWLEENPEARLIYDQAQSIKASGLAAEVLGMYDFSKFHKLCDVGGGQGAFLTHLLAGNPHIRGVVTDMPGVIASAEKTIAKSGLEARCVALACDFFEVAPPVCDAYFLVNILHDWGDDRCRRILENIYRSMNADSKLWVVEHPLAPGSGFDIAKLLDIEVFIMGGGLERTIEDYKALVTTAGLSLCDVIPLSRGLVMLECTKD